jgi:hypothetical protein
MSFSILPCASKSGTYSRLWGALAAAAFLTSCGQYAGRDEVPTVLSEANAPTTGYLIDRSDWVLGVREELLVENRDRPSTGVLVRFDGRSIFVPSGSKILAWKCGGHWIKGEIYVDGQRFDTPTLAPSCLA